LLSTTKAIQTKLDEVHFYWRIGYYALMAAGTVHLFFLFMFLCLGVPVMAAVNVLSVLIYWYSIYGLGIRTIETRDDRLIGWLVYSELLGHNLLATWYLGTGAGFQFYIYILAFFPFFIFTYSRKIYWIRVFLVIAVSLLLESGGLFRHPRVPIDPGTIEALHLLNLLIFLGVLAILSYLYMNYERDHHDRLHTSSRRDPITGLYNRRFIQELLGGEWSDESQWPSPALMLIDIDHFKRLNDSLGHACGDRAIIAVAATLKESVLPSVIVSRWGGEEYLLLFRNIRRDELEKVADRLRRVVSEMRIPCDESHATLTITLGATFVRKNEPFDEALHRADKALYRGKEAGRDRVVIL
jgi:diguanylate cyclase (GGDEF)-like protein